MAKDTYQQLEAQIKKLQAKAEAIKVKSRLPVIASILKSMERYSISVEELGTAIAKAGNSRTKTLRAPKTTVATRRPVAPKYRHPESGETWSGRGKPPRWMMVAEAAGVRRDSFLIG